MYDAFQRSIGLAAQDKDVDVVCRAPVDPTSWLFPLRDIAVAAIESMRGRFRVLAPRDRVPPAEYWQEMRRSRICVSPYGYGEICWRDFEAVIAGALLIKPEMGHVRTRPNIFVPGVTYVPVRWDYADLEEKCTYYLKNEAERTKIAGAARDVLQDALRPEWFFERFAEMLRLAGQPTARQ